VLIDYYFTLLSPFAYLASDRLERMAAAHGADIAYKPADFGRLIAEGGGLPLAKRHPFRVAYRMQELKRLPRRAGVPLNPTPKHWPTDAAPATRALILAIEAGAGDPGAVARAIMRAVWAEEKDVADPAVVAAALREGGCDPALATPSPEAAARADAILAANTDEASARGVFGAPFYIVGDEKFWGHDRLDYLEDHLADLAKG
jgi:2-hydroxychromene-2-carboxylate isomerase